MIRKFKGAYSVEFSKSELEDMIRGYLKEDIDINESEFIIADKSKIISINSTSYGLEVVFEVNEK